MCFPLLISFSKSCVFSDVESNRVGGTRFLCRTTGPPKVRRTFGPVFGRNIFFDFVLRISFVFDVCFFTDFFLKSGVFSDVESNHVGGYTGSMPYHGPAEGPQDLRPSFREKHVFL